MTESSDEPRVRVNDKRRIDPDTFEVRQPEPSPADALSEEETEAQVVEAEFGEVELQVSELTADLQRVHAEYANYRKRVERDREVIREMAIGSVLTDLLSVLDDIDRAREHGELEGAFKTVGENLESTVTRAGLEKYGRAEEPFDPLVHEALTTESRDGVDSPTVVAVYQAGYRLARKGLLRHPRREQDRER